MDLQALDSVEWFFKGWILKNHLCGVDLHGVDLEDSTLLGRDLHGVDLEESAMWVDLHGVDLEESTTWVDLHGAYLEVRSVSKMGSRLPMFCLNF